MPPSRPASQLWRAPAKVNLSLHVLGRRKDGYHELHSVVAFAGVCDWLMFTPAAAFGLSVDGPRAHDAGPDDGNLILKAARALERQVPGLRLGEFKLRKTLPVAAGLGGGSSDAAAALRALAAHNGISLDDPRLLRAAESTGADVTVCLAPRARVMEGIGHQIGPALEMPALPALLVNPGVATPTPLVFAGLRLEPGAIANFGPAFEPAATNWRKGLAAARNDLQSAAVAVAPVIADALNRLSRLPGVCFARMSGSGATCFAIFDDRNDLIAASRALKLARPDWWVRATLLR